MRCAFALPLLFCALVRAQAPAAPPVPAPTPAGVPRTAWSFQAEGGVVEHVTQGAGCIVVTTTKAVSALRPEDGKVLWTYLFKAPAHPRLHPARHGEPVIAGDRFCVGDQDYRVTALDLATGEVRWEKALES